MHNYASELIARNALRIILMTLIVIYVSYCGLRGFFFNNLSIKIYIAPLQDPYSEALPTQAKRISTVLRRWWN